MKGAEKWARKAGGWEKLARALFRSLEAELGTQALTSALRKELEPENISNAFDASPRRGRPRKLTLTAVWALESAAKKLIDDHKASNLEQALDEVQRVLRAYAKLDSNPDSYTAQEVVNRSGIAEFLPVIFECKCLPDDTKSKTLLNHIGEINSAGKKLRLIFAATVPENIHSEIDEP